MGLMNPCQILTDVILHLRCAEGYFGQPSVPGGSCQPCQCNDNLDFSIPGSCDSLSGSCLICKPGTTGQYCELCADGYFGDAVDAKNCQRKSWTIDAHDRIDVLHLKVADEFLSGDWGGGNDVKYMYDRCTLHTQCQNISKYVCTEYILWKLLHCRHVFFNDAYIYFCLFGGNILQLTYIYN